MQVWLPALLGQDSLCAGFSGNGLRINPSALVNVNAIQPSFLQDQHLLVSIVLHHFLPHQEEPGSAQPCCS